MTTAEITQRIRTLLDEHHILPATSPYDDSGSLVSVWPETPWIDGLNGECLIAIYADRVQKWQRDAPFNYSRGRPVGRAIAYNTTTQLLIAIEQLRATPKALCWS